MAKLTPEDLAASVAAAAAASAADLAATADALAFEKQRDALAWSLIRADRTLSRAAAKEKATVQLQTPAKPVKPAKSADAPAAPSSPQPA